MTTTMEQVATQLQEVFAQVTARSGPAEAVQAINNLVTAQVRKDTPSFIDVQGLGRPQESSGKGEDFQQWSKDTESFFAGVIKESEMMLEWAAEKTTEITTEFVDREFLPIMTNQERGVRKLEFILQMHTVLTDLTSGEANDIVANSWKNLFGGVVTTAEEIRSDNRRKEEKPSSHDHFQETLHSSGTPRGN